MRHNRTSPTSTCCRRKRVLTPGSTSLYDWVSRQISICWSRRWTPFRSLKVDTANFSAEFGRSADGVIRVVIKSGTNAIHGDAFEFLRNNALDANDFFANSSRLKRLCLHRSQFGGTVGGPVIKNYSFFFMSYQGSRHTSSQTDVLTVPTAQM